MSIGILSVRTRPRQHPRRRSSRAGRDRRAAELYGALLGAAWCRRPDRVRALVAELERLGYGVEPIADVGLRLISKGGAR